MDFSWPLFLGWLIVVVLLLVGIASFFVFAGRIFDLLVTPFAEYEDDLLQAINPRVDPKGPFKWPCPSWDGQNCNCSPEFCCQDDYVSVTVVDGEGNLVSIAEAYREYMEHEVAAGEQLEKAS